MCLFRSGQEPIVVNLDIPEADEQNKNIWIDDIHSKNNFKAVINFSVIRI